MSGLHPACSRVRRNFSRLEGVIGLSEEFQGVRLGCRLHRNPEHGMCERLTPQVRRVEIWIQLKSLTRLSLAVKFKSDTNTDERRGERQQLEKINSKNRVFNQ